MYSTCVAKRKNFTFRLDPDVIAAIARVAEKDHRSVNNMVEKTLIESLKAAGIDPPKTEDDPDK